MSAQLDRPHWTPTVAAVLVTIVVTYAIVLLLPLTMPAAVPSSDFTPLSAYAPALPFTVLAILVVLLVRAQPRNAVTWLLVTVAVVFPATNIGTDYVQHWLYAPDIPEALVVPLGLLNAVLNQLTALPLEVVPLVFPSGRLVSRRWRIVVWAAVGWISWSIVIALFDPRAIGDGQRFVPNPLAIPAARGLADATNNLSLPFWIVIGVLGIVSLVIRYRRAGADERHQIKWFGAGVSVLILAIVGGSVTSSNTNWTTPAPIAFEIVGFSALPICIGVAILKYRLYDIDVVISRALVYGSLAALITLVYVGIVVGVGTLVGSGGQPNIVLSIVATAVVAVGFQPVRERLQRLANRLVYGKRATPYEVLSEFSERVAETYAAEETLARMARVLGEGTGAEKAQVWLRQGAELRPAAAWPEVNGSGAELNADQHPPGIRALELTGQLLPELPGADRAVPVRHQGELLGALAVSKRTGEPLTPIEEKLLEDLANQAGLVLRNVGLTADLRARLDELRASRQRLVAAQDEERRRLERNLHDGAQQNLVALKVKLGLAEMLAGRDVEKAKTLIVELKADTDEALETLRDLARGIYPPLLADKGLVAAVEAQARKATVPVTVEAEGAERYPQDVEAAVYFCVLEALQNVQKYAQASSAVVRLREEDGALRFEVQDDGAGFDPATVRRGAGTTNMADRLDALGGSLEVDSRPGAGTVVRGTLGPMAVPG